MLPQYFCHIPQIPRPISPVSKKPWRVYFSLRSFVYCRQTTKYPVRIPTAFSAYAAALPVVGAYRIHRNQAPLRQSNEASREPTENIARNERVARKLSFTLQNGAVPSECEAGSRRRPPGAARLRPENVSRTSRRQSGHATLRSCNFCSTMRAHLETKK